MRTPLPLARQGGFTLIELLITIGIVAVLAALIMTGLRTAQVSGMSARSAGNIRQLALANLAYAAENGRYAPADDRFNLTRWHGARPSASAPFDATKGYLSPYLGKEARVIQCPLFKEMLKGRASFEEGSGGYGYNAAYMGGQPGGVYEPTGPRVTATPAVVTDPGQTVMFTSTAYATAAGVQEYPYTEPPFWDFGEGPSGARPSPSTHFRFSGNALVAWADAHTSLEPPTDRPAGTNPHGGNAAKHSLGWFGPDAGNGYWNPRK